MSTVDQWVDWGGHTVTVDPIGSATWVQDGDTFTKHMNSVKRGRDYNADEVKKMQSLLGSQTAPVMYNYLPTTAALQTNRFPSRAQADTFVPYDEELPPCPHRHATPARYRERSHARQRACRRRARARPASTPRAPECPQSRPAPCRPPRPAYTPPAVPILHPARCLQFACQSPTGAAVPRKSAKHPPGAAVAHSADPP